MMQFLNLMLSPSFVINTHFAIKFYFIFSHARYNLDNTYYFELKVLF